MKGAEKMNLKELKELIEAVNRSAITHFEMEQEGLKLNLRKDTAFPTDGAQASVMAMAAYNQLPAVQQFIRGGTGLPAGLAALPPVAPATAFAAAPATAPVALAATPSAATLANEPAAALAAAPANLPASTTPAAAVEEEGILLVKSPMVGVFYEASQPGAPPFVKIGDQICKGQVLCIIEAMKLMNEVQAEIEGTIIDILIKNEEMAEYGQPLFKVKSK